MDGIAHHVHQTCDVLRYAESHWHVKHFFCEFHCAFHLCASARQYHARRDHFLEARAAQLFADQRKQFFVARLDDFRERLTRKPTRRAISDARHFDGFVRVRELRQRASKLHLDLFGVMRRRAQTDGDVVRNLIACNRNDGGMSNRPTREHRHVRRAAADIDDANT